jgi:hypothetical protein
MEGRLHLGTALGAMTLAIIGVLAGVNAGTDLTRLSEDEARARAFEELSFQNAEWADSFYGAVQNVRAQALLLGAGQKIAAGSLLHWTQYQLVDRKATPLKTFRAEQVTQAQEAEWLKQAAEKTEQWGPGLKGNAFGLLRFRPDPASTREWLGLIFREADTYHAAAVQPSQAFPFLSRFSSRSAGGTRRIYLVGVDGSVLVHSQDSYTGTNLKGIPVFDLALAEVAKGSRKSGVGEYEGVERVPIWAAYARIGSLPLIAVTEVVPPVKRWLAPGWQRTAGQLLLVLGVLCFAAAGLSAFPARAALQMRRVSLQQQSQPSKPASDPFAALFTAPPLPEEVEAEGATVAGPVLTQVGNKVVGSRNSEAPSAPAYPESLGFGETMLREDLRASQETLRSLEEERKVLSEVEDELFKIQDPEMATRRMTQGVSRLCGSPTMFFQFQETLRTASLKYDAGFASGHAPAELTFPIDESMLQRLTALTLQGSEEARNEGRRILSENAALARIILVRTGVAHFEAWPVFRYSALGRAAGRPRLHGVLIILQAGEAAYTRGESIGRMIRSAALVYENATHAQ